MSRADLQKLTDIGRPLTDEEKAYLRVRSRIWEIDENERRHGQKAEDEVPLFATPEVEPVHDLDKFDQALVSEVKALKLSELKDELRQRGLPETGSRGHMEFTLVNAVSQGAK